MGGCVRADELVRILSGLKSVHFCAACKDLGVSRWGPGIYRGRGSQAKLMVGQPKSLVLIWIPPRMYPIGGSVALSHFCK